jgi:hypothetical protein
MYSPGVEVVNPTPRLLSIRTAIRALVPRRVLARLRRARVAAEVWRGNTSYAQEGEDMILRRVFEGVARGFYVDVGAHHPHRFSNTHWFYRQGWSGINIDASPGSMTAFKWSRPRDINLEVAVDLEEGERQFFRFEDPALNTFLPDVAAERLAHGYHVIGRDPVATRRLGSILDEYAPRDGEIHFFSVDTEGSDLRVLRSNLWTRHRPAVVLVETRESTIADVQEGEISAELSQHGYEFFAKSLNTSFFRRLDGVAIGR